MTRTRHRNSRKTGLAPGTPVYIGDTPAGAPTELTLTIFGEGTYEKKTIAVSDVRKVVRDTEHFYWFDFMGIHDTAKVQEICTAFDIHPLIQEDIVNTNQRAKAEELDGYTFAVMKSVALGTEETVQIGHFPMICGDRWLISFRESGIDPYLPVRKRFQDSSSRLRSLGIDYLFFALIDTIVDSYYHIVEQIDDILDTVSIRQREYFATIPDEHDVKLRSAVKPDRDELLRVHSVFMLKSQLHTLRRTIFPVRDVINHLIVSERFTMGVKIYVRDVQDHMTYITENIDLFREMADGIVGMALSLITFRTNAIMKTLAIVSTIFIPLMFLAGLYGMNFENMPELKYEYAYFIVLGVMALAAGGLVWFLRKRRWW